MRRLDQIGGPAARQGRPASKSSDAPHVQREEGFTTKARRTSGRVSKPSFVPSVVRSSRIERWTPRPAGDRPFGAVGAARVGAIGVRLAGGAACAKSLRNWDI